MPLSPRKLKFYSLRNIHQLPQFKHLSPREQRALKVVGQVFPFRVNNYVTDELIDWSQIPDDPMYQLTFLQEPMLLAQDFASISDALEREAADKGVKTVVLDAREPAVGFYEKLGYRVEAKSYVLFGEIQHYRMIKHL